VHWRTAVPSFPACPARCPPGGSHLAGRDLHAHTLALLRVMSGGPPPLNLQPHAVERGPGLLYGSPTTTREPFSVLLGPASARYALPLPVRVTTSFGHAGGARGHRLDRLRSRLRSWLSLRVAARTDVGQPPFALGYPWVAPDAALPRCLRSATGLGFDPVDDAAVLVAGWARPAIPVGGSDWPRAPGSEPPPVRRRRGSTCTDDSVSVCLRAVGRGSSAILGSRAGAVLLLGSGLWVAVERRACSSFRWPYKGYTGRRCGCQVPPGTTGC